ncbi:MAG: hypothetical protein EHM20_06680 [Alphaproteobacteria bacterium]|nr:MAG: hypothetical protein EHM20_06680 [Alphaproteobacteria bacterium]
MATEQDIREMYQINRKAIMSAVRKLSTGKHIEVGFFESGKVLITDQMDQHSYAGWEHVLISVSYPQDQLFSYEKQDDKFDYVLDNWESLNFEEGKENA